MYLCIITRACMKLIELNISKITDLCKKIQSECKKYRVKSLAVFGSILTDHSDVDLLVNN